MFKHLGIKRGAHKLKKKKKRVSGAPCLSQPGTDPSPEPEVLLLFHARFTPLSRVLHNLLTPTWDFFPLDTFPHSPHWPFPRWGETSGHRGWALSLLAPSLPLWWGKSTATLPSPNWSLLSQALPTYLRVHGLGPVVQQHCEEDLRFPVGGILDSLQHAVRGRVACCTGDSSVDPVAQQQLRQGLTAIGTGVVLRCVAPTPDHPDISPSFQELVCHSLVLPAAAQAFSPKASSVQGCPTLASAQAHVGSMLQVERHVLLQASCCHHAQGCHLAVLCSHVHGSSCL